MKRKYHTYLKKTQGEESVTNTAFFNRMNNDKSERELRQKIREEFYKQDNPNTQDMIVNLN